MEGCVECGGKLKVDDKDEIVCGGCGVISGSQINDIGYSSRKELGSVIDGAGPEDWEDVRIMNHRHKGLNEKIMAESTGLEREVEERIETAGAHLGMPDYMIQETKNLLSKFSIKFGGFHGIDKEEMVGACIYAAHRISGENVSIDEIADEMNIIPKRVTSKYKILRNNVSIKPMVIEPSNYIRDFANKVGSSHETQKIALDILDEIPTKGSPRVMAVSALYVASCTNSERIEQKKFAIAGECTTVSIRNCSRYIREKLSEED